MSQAMSERTPEQAARAGIRNLLSQRRYDALQRMYEAQDEIVLEAEKPDGDPDHWRETAAYEKATADLCERLLWQIER